jgi:hypothetical protein
MAELSDQLMIQLYQTNSTVTSFTASGTFTSRTGQPSVHYLVVAGGGAGGGFCAGGLEVVEQEVIRTGTFPCGTQLCNSISNYSKQVEGVVQIHLKDLILIQQLQVMEHHQYF